MASPHVPADLMQPVGMLTLGLFPAYANQAALDVFLQALLDEGYVRADSLDTQDRRDAAAIAWAYHMAYLSIWQRMSATPLTAKIDGEGERGYAATQIAAFLKLSNDARAEFDALLTSTALVTPAVTTGVVTKYRW